MRTSMVGQGMVKNGGDENIIKNEIIGHLEEIPANTIYAIAPSQYVTRGFEYYKNREASLF